MTSAQVDAGTQLTQLTEAALLGALLWDPRRLRDVEWLDAADFYRPAYQAIYATLAGMLRDGRTIDLLKLPQVLAIGDYHDLYTRSAVLGDGRGPEPVPASGNEPLSASALSELLSMTPASPPPTDRIHTSGHSEHRRYAEIVLEDSIRRQVVSAGARIEQVDHAYAKHDIDDVFHALDRALEQTATRLDDLTRRLWESGQTSAAITTNKAPASMGRAESHAAVRRSTPSTAALRHAEHTLIGACVTMPWLRELAQQQLRAEDFASPEVSATWLALDELTSRGTPVDYVLLAAQVQRLGNHPRYGPGIEPLRLATLARRSDMANGACAVTEVARAALSHAMRRAQQALANTGATPAHTSEQILANARAALSRIEATRFRLSEHTGPSQNVATPTNATTSSRITTARTPQTASPEPAARTTPGPVVPAARQHGRVR